MTIIDGPNFTVDSSDRIPTDMNESRVLICGDRNWMNKGVITTVLNGLLDNEVMNFGVLTIIEGCARGADWFACHYFDGCKVHTGHYSVKHMHFPAQWKKYGKSAGPIRNQQMLDEGQPDIVFAFHDNIHDSKGTKDMANRASKAGIPVYIIGKYNG